MAPSPTPTMDSLIGLPSTSKITVGWEWGSGDKSARSWTGTLYTQIWCNEDGGAFGQVKSFTDQPDREAWDHAGRSSNVAYGYKVRYADDSGNGTFSNILYITMFDDSADDTVELDEDTTDTTTAGDITTDTVTLAESTSDVATMEDSAEETVRVFDSPGDVYTLSLQTNYGYYLGGFDGNVYQEAEGYTSDNGVAIHAYWISKDTDFSDFDEDSLSRFKTVYKARLFYLDKSAGQNITLSISNDGGTTWTVTGRNVGTGDNTVKSTDFFFIITGDVFQVKIEHNDTTGKFQWLNLELFYTVGGQYFEI